MDAKAKSNGPRVLIATLFLPETVTFDEPPASPLTSLSTHLEAQSPALTSNFPIPFPSLNQSKDKNSSTPIHSGHNSPSIAFHGSRAASPALGQSSGPVSGSVTPSALTVPTLPAIAALSQSGGANSRPKPARGMSIVEDLQTKGTGFTGISTPAITPGEKELGTNPFDVPGATGLSPAISPQPTGTGGQVPPKRPGLPGRVPSTLNKFTSEGSKSPSLSTGAGVTGLENRRPSGVSAKTASIIDPPTTSSSAITRPTPASNLPGRPNLASRATDFFTSKSLTDSSNGVTSVGTSPVAQRIRRRSSSVARAGQSNASGVSLSRTFSRSARKPGEHRRRSSSSLEGSSQYAINTLPPYYFESNPHGNGGLQNAVRSVADVHMRSISDPGSNSRGGSVPAIPASKNTIGEYAWVGTLGCGIDEFDDALRKDIERRYKEEKKSHVVWVEDQVLEPAYDSFCKQVLWGTFHYQMHDVYKVGKSKAYEASAWQAYVSMNQSFADKIVASYQPGDQIWVNDYHLLLLPAMVRQKLPEATIGFFLHIAFPSSEIFRCLANRRELLEGVLGADLVGFQTYNTARHFRQTCQRLLSVEATPKGIQLENGFTRVGVFPIGIDVKALHERKKAYEVTEWVSTLRERYAGQRVIIGRDKLDEIKGVRQKLVAFEAFLEKYPEWQGKVVLIQVAMATALENEKQGEVMDVVARINARFSTFTYQPVVFLHQDVSFSQYLALLTIADCFINSSLREGMNLTSHEFIICQEGQWAPLILSEFTGSYSRAGFQRCIPINPFDKFQCRDAIYEALTMPEDERISRWRDLERHVWSQTAQHWCTGFISALQREVVDVKTRPLASPGLGGQQIQPPSFDSQSALVNYNDAKKRLLLIDLEGTLFTDSSHRNRKHYKKGLLAEENQHNHIQLEKETQDALDQLSEDSKNTMYLMSGRSRDDLSGLAQRFPKLGLVAENGCFVASPQTQPQPSSSARTWHKLISGTHQSWRAPVLEILQYYTERTPGSFIDDRGVSIVWRYANTEDKAPMGENKKRRGSNVPAQRGADIGLIKDDGEVQSEPPRFEHGTGNEAYHWARRQAAEVQNHIMDSLGERFGLQLYPGATSFLILPRKAGRAIAVAHILQSDDFSDVDEAVDEETDDNQVGTEQEQQRETEDGNTTIDSSVNESTTTIAEPSTMEERRPSKEISKATASKQLLEQFDYVLSLGEDQRLCTWLEEMALDKVVTVSVGNKKRGARWHLAGPEQVGEALKTLATSIR